MEMEYSHLMRKGCGCAAVDIRQVMGIGNRRRTVMGINDIRSWLYKIAALMGDVNAVKKDKVGRRVVRRGAGKVVGKGFQKWLK